MSQSGLRHAATEPDHLDGKRDRSRRTASGRAAALRRAPSDSDCSGETASLSADSADRVRPALIPQRTAKARSRRRGSEWEVLEGLKDGQRFERRPEVFNGYLHKKRKWPLKGWHKRFFVIDGGILVYARSPADVARGRLHGSLDVGLSVVSAKARRRRVDIDADEVIYHLRAKTPDVFRTWLSVLKTHRLYRQHLLTFGARESAAKIHTPLEEIPSIDTSVQSSSSSLLTPCSDDDSEVDSSDVFQKFIKEPDSFSFTPPNLSLSNQNTVNDWNTETDNSELMPLKFEPLEEVFVKPDLYNRSLCSMNCLAKIYRQELRKLRPRSNTNESPRVSIAEKQLHATELERNSIKINSFIESSLFAYSFNSPNQKIYGVTKDRPIKPVFPVFDDIDEPLAKKNKVKKSGDKFDIVNKKLPPTKTFYLFTHKDKPRAHSPISQMKRSKKSTNLVKYRNCTDEPPLEKPLHGAMLLRKSKNASKASAHENVKSKVNNEVQTSEMLVDVPRVHKSQQDNKLALEYDKIAQKLVFSMFDTKKLNNSNSDDITTCVNRMVRELYEVSLNESAAHPTKMLYRCLLEYWLKNSSSEHIKNAVRNAKSVVTQSTNLTRDQNVSTVNVSSTPKETQIQPSNRESLNTLKETHVQSDHNVPKDIFTNSNIRQVTYNFMKDRRIQELERLLKNTVYTVENACSNDSKLKDIEFTKKLLNNLESRTSRGKDFNPTTQGPTCSFVEKGGHLHENLTQDKDNNDISNSSTEYPQILETFDRMISETSISPAVVKGFLGAYLSVLTNESGNNNVTLSSDNSKPSNNPKCSICNVQTESVKKKASIGFIATFEKDTNTSMTKLDTFDDFGQMYLKNILNKVTTIFKKENIQNDSKESADKQVQPDDTKVEGSFKCNKKYVDKQLISENKDENSVVIDLTKYDLEHISMYSDSTVKGNLSITIKLKERFADPIQSQPKNLNLKFSGETSMTRLKTGFYRSPNCTTKNFCRPKMDPRISFKNPYIHYEPNNEKKELKPFLSASDGTSNAFRIMYESECSLDFSLRNDSKRSFETYDDSRSCYVISSVKKSTRTSLFKPKYKYRSIGNSVMIRSREQSVRSIQKRPQKCIFKKPVSMIDKKFIFLLLENLTLLSQGIPDIYNEMSVFYLKLKKKHEKEINTGGVGLLGRIYNNENNQTGECSRQADVKTHHLRTNVAKGSNNETAMNTNDNSTRQKVDRCISIAAAKRNAETQAEELVSTKTKKLITVAIATSSTEICGVSGVNQTGTATANVAIYSEIKEDYGITTVLKTILNEHSSSSNFRFVTNDDNYHRRAQYCSDATHDTKKRISFKDISDDNEHKHFKYEIRPVLEKRGIIKDPKTKNKSASASRMQTDNFGFFKIKHEDDTTPPEKDGKKRKNFMVYSIFVSSKFPVTLSSSCTVSSDDLKFSDDVKTLYRRFSVPSIVSG